MRLSLMLPTAFACGAAAFLLAAPADADYLYRAPIKGAAKVETAPASGPSGTRIFVTATAYDGNLGGLSGADAKCMADANKPNDGRTYVALLSTGSVAANSRVTFTYPVRFAATPTTVYEATDLWSGTRETALPARGVATGFTSGGGINGAYGHCDGWTTNLNNSGGTTRTVIAGNSGATDSYWAYSGTGICVDVRSLYCVSTTP